MDEIPKKNDALKNAFDWFKRNNSEIVIGSSIILLVIVFMWGQAWQSAAVQMCTLHCDKMYGFKGEISSSEGSVGCACFNPNAGSSHANWSVVPTPAQNPN